MSLNGISFSLRELLSDQLGVTKLNQAWRLGLIWGLAAFVSRADTFSLGEDKTSTYPCADASNTLLVSTHALRSNFRDKPWLLLQFYTKRPIFSAEQNNQYNEQIIAFVSPLTVMLIIPDIIIMNYELCSNTCLCNLVWIFMNTFCSNVVYFNVNRAL